MKLRANNYNEILTALPVLGMSGYFIKGMEIPPKDCMFLFLEGREIKTVSSVASHEEVSLSDFISSKFDTLLSQLTPIENDVFPFTAGRLRGIVSGGGIVITEFPTTSDGKIEMGIMETSGLDAAVSAYYETTKQKDIEHHEEGE